MTAFLVGKDVFNILQKNMKKCEELIKTPAQMLDYFRSYSTFQYLTFTAYNKYSLTVQTFIVVIQYAAST